MNIIIEYFRVLFNRKHSEAYKEGFDDGMKHEMKTHSRDYVVKYVDLGLPSGKKVGIVYSVTKNGKSICRLPYCEAEKFNIPTWDEFRELAMQTRMEFDFNWTGRTSCTMRGPNGNSIVIYNFWGEIGAVREKGLKVWLKSSLTDDMKASVAWLRDGKTTWDSMQSSLFSGEMAVVLVLD